MIDGFRGRALGAYGNTCSPTPALDRFASESLLFDRCLTESTQLEAIYRSIWTGQHAMPSGMASQHAPLIERLSDEGYSCHLVTDEQALITNPLAERFDEKVLIDTGATEFAVDLADSSFGKMFAAVAEVAGEWASEYEQPRCLWAHLRGFHAPWDAPIELAATLLEDDDPELLPSVAVPRQIVTDADESADEIFHATCRYAGQVIALDECFGALQKLFANIFPDEPPVVILAGTRGFPLGEHGAIGDAGVSLPYGEEFHVPLIIHSPYFDRSLQRHWPLVQISDLYEMILRAAQGNDPLPVARKIARGSTAAGDVFLQDDEWHFVRRADDTLARELYVKPDDLWEANDVAIRCPEIVEEWLRQCSSDPGQLHRSTPPT